MKNREQHELWLKAINRVNADGSPWVPHIKKEVICSDHFVRGKPKPSRNDPDYVPSIFHSGPRPFWEKPKTPRDCARFDRLMKRRMAASRVRTPTTADELDSPSEMSSEIPDIKVSPVQGGDLALHVQHDTLSQEIDFDLTGNSLEQPTESLYEAQKPIVSIPNGLLLKPMTPRDCAQFDCLMKMRMAASTASAAATTMAPSADELDSPSEMSSMIADIKASSVQGGNLALHEQQDTLSQEIDFEVTLNSLEQPANSLYGVQKPIVSVPKKLSNRLLLKKVEPSIVLGLNLKPVSPTDITHLVKKKGIKSDPEAMTDIPPKSKNFLDDSLLDGNKADENMMVPPLVEYEDTASQTSSERPDADGVSKCRPETSPVQAADMAMHEQVDTFAQVIDSNFSMTSPRQPPIFSLPSMKSEYKKAKENMVQLEDDEDTAFFKYMATLTRRMEKQDKRAFFREIQDILPKYERGRGH